VLERLPEPLRDELPWDWKWAFVDTFLDKSWTNNLNYDMIKRQGVSNMVEKILIAGAEAFDAFHTRYYFAAQLWWTQLEASVGEEAYNKLDDIDKALVLYDRNEYLYFCDEPNKVRPLWHAAGRACTHHKQSTHSSRAHPLLAPTFHRTVQPCNPPTPESFPPTAVCFRRAS
jgi:hypothetical protein